LREHPDAFTSSYEEDRDKPIATTVKRLAPDSGDIVFGAFVDGQLVGIAGIGRETRRKNAHKATVFGMFVAPEHAGRGIGDALLAHLIAAAKRDSTLTQLVLTVTDTNTRAIALYERAGFASFGVEPRAIRVGDSYFGKNHMYLSLR
jgi:ribosomal protein S18 acetylase RimI-like enzyme